MKKSLDTVETNIICYLLILIVFIFHVTFFVSHTRKQYFNKYSNTYVL